MMPYTPRLAGGNFLHSYGVVRALAAHRPVDVAYQVWGVDDPSEEWAKLDNVTLHAVTPSKRLLRIATYTHRRATGVPENIARGVSYELVRAARALADTAERGRVIADGLFGAGALLPLAAHRPVVYDGQNLESSFRHRHRVTARGMGSATQFRAFERRLLETMVEAWMVSPRDVEGARALAPSARVRYVPNVIDVKGIRPVIARPGNGRILFVGQFSYEPNRIGLRFLLEEVMPRVWDRLPESRLAVVGGGLDSEAAFDPRVEVRGYVEDLDAEYRQVDCAVVPLLEGGGTPLKFVEALAYELPVVATPLAAAGLDVRASEHYLEGADAAAFSDQVIEALSPRGDALGRAGRRLVEHAYSIDALTRILAPDAG